MEAVAELPLSVAEVEEALSNPEHFGLKEFVWYAFNPPQSFAEKQPDRCLYSRLGVSAEQFELLARQWVLPDTQRAEVLKQKDQSVRNLLLGARRRGAPRLTMVLCRSIKWVERTKVKIRWIMYGTDSASSEPSMDAPLPVAPLAASNTLQLLVAGGGAAAGGSTEQKKARETRFNFSELRLSITRSLQKVGTCAAHERRAAHEAKVFDQLLQWLLALPNRDGVVIIADWKMKFLSAAFREAMSAWFGKAGMPWHGMLFIRCATAHELAADGEFIASYIDSVTDDKKEDGYSTLSAVYLGFKGFKAENPFTNQAAFKMDGAGCYAGIVFTVGLSMLGELTGIRVVSAHTGESGKNKSQLDGHFGTKGSQVRRLVASGLHDMLTPETLFQGVAKTLGKNEKAMHLGSTALRARLSTPSPSVS